jgi:thiamine-phosphate pyrophosphorylase
MASQRQPNTKPQPASPRLYLFTPLITNAEAFAPLLEEALDVADIAALLMRFETEDERTLSRDLKRLFPAVQERDVAVLLDGAVELALRSNADGAHLTGIEALQAGLKKLKPQRIAGAGGLATRHDAMLAGEAGADYLMFGEPDAGGNRPSLEAIIERLSWWSELFELPCVGFAGSMAEIASLAATGADFIALGDWIWSDARGPAAALAAVNEQLELV